MPKAAVGTTTMYSSRTPRSDLALTTIRTVAADGYPISVVDAGSFPEFCGEVQNSGFYHQGVNPGTGLVVLQKQGIPGMGPSRRQTLEKAGELAGPGGATVWTEPEKPIWKYLAQLTHPILRGEADLAILWRKSLESYPPEQAHAEHFGRLVVEYITRRKFDFWAGSFAVSQRALPYYLEYEGDYGDEWDSMMVPHLQVLAAGLHAVRVEVDYVHPPEQTAYETGKEPFILRRVLQLFNIVPALYTEAHKLGLISF